MFGVFEVGNYLMRYGIAGEDAPRRVDLNTYCEDKDGCLTSFGDAAVFGNHLAQRLVEDSVVKNIDGICYIGKHYDESLGLTPTGVLYSINLSMPLTCKLALMESHFDLTNQRAVSLTSSPCLSMYSTGRTSGLALNLGHDGCEIGALSEGTLIGSNSRFSPFSGRQISEQLHTWLQRRYPNLFNSPYLKMMTIVEDIKAKKCQVSMEGSTLDSSSQQYEMPDGQMIDIAPDAMNAPDMFFKPENFGLTCSNLLQLIESSLSDQLHDLSNEDLNRTLVLTGGSSMFINLPERLEVCIRQSNIIKSRIRLVATMERKYSSWIGGSILASLTAFNNITITRESFDEEGVYRVYRKHCAATFCC